MSGVISGIQVFREKFALGELSPDCKPFVVALDFGTSYSGIAFAYKADPGTIYYGAPTAIDVAQRKVPTALLQLEDGTWEFGNKAKSKYNEILANHYYTNPDAPAVPAHLYMGFRRVLNGFNSGFDTITAVSVDGKPHPLIDLFTRVLQNLKDFAIERLSSGWGTLIVAKEIQWVITVPAIWDDFGKAFMRKAAFYAGLMETEQSDDLILVLEPECAALAVHLNYYAHNLLEVESRFLVLDCGGRKVSITSHEVKGTHPLVLRGISIPTGGPWGGDYVNLEFKKFLKELLGPDMYKESEMPYEFYQIDLDFDKIKMNFNPQREPGNIRMTDVLDNKKQLWGLAEIYNINNPDNSILMTPSLRNGYLTMSKELMVSFFEPFLQPIVDETRKVLAELGNIRNIVVVGGFGASNVLTDPIRSEFDDRDGVSVLLPDIKPKPQEAISHGAVYFGLYKNILIQSRVSPYTYGVNGLNGSFHVLVRKGEELPHDHEVLLSGIPTTEDQASISWRLYRSDKVAPTTVTGEHLLGTLTAWCPPNPVQANRELVWCFQFGTPEIRVSVRYSNNVECRVELMVY